MHTNADLEISLYFVFKQKQYPKNFALLTLRILELFAPVCKK